jgi:hypothetical protein
MADFDGDQPTAHVLYSDSALQLITWRDLFVQRWIGQGGASHVAHMLEAHLAFTAKHGPKRTISVSHVATTTFKPPDEEARRLMTRHTAEIGPRLRASATVIEMDGFAGAMMRSIIAGLIFVTGHKEPHQVTSTAREGIAFVLRHRHPEAQPIDLDDLMRIYATACG